VTTRIAVIGAGPGGYVAALRAAQLGADVTLVDRDNVGGTCLNWGCVPTKVMKHTAETLDKTARFGALGIRIEGRAEVCMADLMARKERVVRDQAQGVLNLLRHRKVRYLRGTAILRGPNLVSVETPGQCPVELEADRLILAPGAAPMGIPSCPFDGERVISSKEALDLRRVPESLLIVGAGVIGCEFAFIFSALGARVILVEGLSSVLCLPSVDADSAKVLHREMKKRRIQVLLNRTVTGIDGEADACRVFIAPSPMSGEAAPKGAKEEPLSVEKVLVCIGRKPESDGLGLECVGLKTDGRGWLKVDERMATGVPGIHAAGDILGPSRPMLAHVASAEATLAAENAMGGNRRMDYRVVPNAIFTMPEVAGVGLTEAQAVEQGYPVRVETVLFRTVAKSHILDEIAGEGKIVCDAGTGKILGVHLIGPNATDLIGEGALAVQLGCTVSELAETIHAHPTLSEIYAETAFKALGRSVHG